MIANNNYFHGVLIVMLLQFISNILPIDVGLVVQKLINANPRLKVNQGVYFSTPSCCLTLIFGKTLH